MIPSSVDFTDFNIDPHSFISPRKRDTSFVPPHWVRIQFTHNTGFVSLGTVDRWIEKNMSGHWASGAIVSSSFVHHIILHFEDPSDAVMFRLMDGEQNCVGNGNDDEARV